MSITDLARRLGTSKQSVRYTITQLEDAGVIQSYYTAVNFAALGLLQYRTYLQLRTFSVSKQREVLDSFENLDSVCWVGKYLGDWDIQIAFLADSFIHLSWLLRDLQDSILSLCARHTHAQTVYSYFFSRDYLVGSRQGSRQVTARVPDVQQGAIDFLDARILHELASNCRISFKELGERVESNPKVVRTRVRRLERQKIIQHYRISIDLVPLSVQQYKVKIFLEECPVQREEQLYAYCTTFLEVMSMSQFLGAWQLDLDLEVPNRNQLRKFVEGLREKFSDVIRDLEILEGLYCHKINYFPFHRWEGRMLEKKCLTSESGGQRERKFA